MALTDSLRAAYKLDDTSDYSGNDYTLTNTGTVTFGAGLIGNCAILGENNSSKTLSTSDAVGVALTDDWTISFFWQAPTNYYTNLSQSQFVWGTSGSGNNNSATFGYDKANTRWIIFSSSSQGLTTETITAGNWYNIIAMKSGSTLYLYVNTTQKGSVAVGSTTNLTPRFELNKQNDAFWWTQGKVDLLYIWDRALSSDERSELYNSGNGKEISFGNPSAFFQFI